MTYDAATFLNELYCMEVKPPLRLQPAKMSADPIDLPPEWHLEWDERAAIMEYHGGLTREHAEADAMKDIQRRMKIENGVNCT